VEFVRRAQKGEGSVVVGGFMHGEGRRTAGFLLVCSTPRVGVFSVFPPYILLHPMDAPSSATTLPGTGFWTVVVV